MRRTCGLGQISTNREGTKRYFHFDGLGSTWALTDENENVTDNYSYSAFGVTVTATSTNGPSVNPMRFGGRWGYYDDGAMGASSGLVLQTERFSSFVFARYWTPAFGSNANAYTPYDFGNGEDMGGQPPCEKPWKYVRVTCYGNPTGPTYNCGKGRPIRVGDCAVALDPAHRVCSLGQYISIKHRGENKIIKKCRACDTGRFSEQVDVYFDVEDSECEEKGPWHTGFYCVKCSAA